MLIAYIYTQQGFRQATSKLFAAHQQTNCVIKPFNSPPKHKPIVYTALTMKTSILRHRYILFKPTPSGKHLTPDISTLQTKEDQSRTQQTCLLLKKTYHTPIYTPQDTPSSYNFSSLLMVFQRISRMYFRRRTRRKTVLSRD